MKVREVNVRCEPRATLVLVVEARRDGALVTRRIVAHGGVARGIDIDCEGVHAPQDAQADDRRVGCGRVDGWIAPVRSRLDE